MAAAVNSRGYTLASEISWTLKTLKETDLRIRSLKFCGEEWRKRARPGAYDLEETVNFYRRESKCESLADLEEELEYYEWYHNFLCGLLEVLRDNATEGSSDD